MIESDFITVKEAARISGATVVTIRNWARDLGIGNKAGGKWIIDPMKLNKVMSGEIHYPYRYGRRKKKHAKNKKNRRAN